MIEIKGRQSTWLKLELIFACLVVVVFAVSSFYVREVKISTFENAPTFGWVMLGSLIMVVCIRRIFCFRCSKSKIVSAMSPAIIISLFPFISGFHIFGRGDALTHLSYVKGVVSTGHLIPDFYPGIHVLASSVVLVTGVDYRLTSSTLPPLFLLLYLGGIVLIGRLVVKDRKLLFFLPVAILPIIGTKQLLFAPYIQAFMISSIAIFSFLNFSRNVDKRMKFLSLFLTSSIVIYHFMVALFLSVIISILSSSIRYLNSSTLTGWSIGGIGYCLTTVILWFVSFTGLKLIFSNILLSYIVPSSSSSSSQLETYSSLLSANSIHFIDILSLVVFKYGGVLLITASVVVLAIVNLRKRGFNPSSYNIIEITFTLSFILFGIVALILFAGNFVVGYGRAFKFMHLLGIVSIFLLGRSHITHLLDQRSTYAIMLSACLVLSVVSIGGAYPSPNTKQISYEVTEIEQEGTEWLVQYKSEMTPAKAAILDLGRFEQLARANPSADISDMETGTPPSHFNYQNGKRQYLITGPVDNDYYPEVYPRYKESWKYSPNDFVSIDTKKSMDRVFSSGEFKVYLVN